MNAPIADSDSGGGQFAISPNGTLAYVPGGIRPEDRRTLVWVDRNGDVEPLEAPPRSYWSPRLSPDGNRIALHAYTNMLTQIWVYDVARNTVSLVSPEPGASPGWTPDGTRLVYSSAPGDSGGSYSELIWSAADGREGAQRLLRAEAGVQQGSWTPDGKLLAYAVGAAAGEIGSRDIWVIEPQSDGVGRVILDASADEYQPRFSPDGRWLAYVSNQSGIDEIYVQPFPGPGQRIQISNAGGKEPVWSRDGAELFYRSQVPRQVMAVRIHTGEQLIVSRARALFDDLYVTSTSGSMDVGPDGRFLMLRRDTEERTELYDEVRIVLNWTHELDP